MVRPIYEQYNPGNGMLLTWLGGCLQVFIVALYYDNAPWGFVVQKVAPFPLQGGVCRFQGVRLLLEM